MSATSRWITVDQNAASFHAFVARYEMYQGNLAAARREQLDAAYYAKLARKSLLRLLRTISFYEQDV